MALDRVLKIKNAFKSFGKTEVLKAINLEIFKGEIAIILGDNGAGKSTLIKCISGLDKFSRFDEFKINEKNINNFDFKSIRNLGLEVVFQDSSVCKNQEIYRNIFATRHIKKFGFIDKKSEIKIANEILKNHLNFSAIGLNAKSKALNLSGGERQGLMIARAIYFKSSILILDEPTTALGVKQKEKLINYIKSLKDVSVILITHNLNFAYEVGDRFLLLRDGSFKKESKKDEISSLEMLYRFFNE